MDQIAVKKVSNDFAQTLLNAYFLSPFTFCQFDTQYKYISPLFHTHTYTYTPKYTHAHSHSLNEHTDSQIRTHTHAYFYFFIFCTQFILS